MQVTICMWVTMYACRTMVAIASRLYPMQLEFLAWATEILMPIYSYGLPKNSIQVAIYHLDTLDQREKSVDKTHIAHL